MKLEFGQVTQMFGAGPPITLPEFTVLGTVSRITIAVPPCPTDTNADGVTNVLDLIQLLLQFGNACP